LDELLRALDASTRLTTEYSIQAVLLTMLLAFVLGQVVAWTYTYTHSGLSYARSFTQSLVLMTLVVSLVMLVIGNSIATAFGLLGALALIRFRNVLKDTRDTVFVFISLVVGMAVGTQRYLAVVMRPPCWDASVARSSRSRAVRAATRRPPNSSTKSDCAIASAGPTCSTRFAGSMA
jgi:hypothetical protein